MTTSEPAQDPAPESIEALTTNLRDQLRAQQLGGLPIAEEGGNPVYLLMPTHGDEKDHKAAAERLIAAGCTLGHRYIGGSSPIILAVAA